MKVPKNCRDLTGQIFERLTVLAITERPSHIKTKGAYWLCRCSCGVEKTIKGSSLMRGSSKSCGCLSRDTALLMHSTHGLSYHPLFMTWQGMINRCYNVHHEAYERYKDKGVCLEWRENPQIFFDDIGPKPSATHTLDRIDGTKGYYKDNCRWATPIEQSHNKVYIKDLPLGVSRHGNKFRARLCGKFLGAFDTSEKASEVYTAALSKIL